jgi:hypothetical protein
MKRHALPTAVAAALIATLAVAGCKKREETTTPPPSATATLPAPAATTAAPMAPATTAAPAPSTTAGAPAATALTVSTLDLGNAIGADNRIASPSTSFAKTDTIHASVATDGPGGDLTAKWTMGDKVVDTQNKTVAAGPQVTEFSISKPGGWPTGHYKLEVMAGANTLKTAEFDIK